MEWPVSRGCEKSLPKALYFSDVTREASRENIEMNKWEAELILIAFEVLSNEWEAELNNL